jgi:hypothetical protein
MVNFVNIVAKRHKKLTEISENQQIYNIMREVIRMKRLIVLAILLIVLVSGCIQNTQYVCPDGGIVSDSNLCQVEEDSSNSDTVSENKNNNELLEQADSKNFIESSEDFVKMYKEHCKDKYPEDFNMREFCERQQVEGYEKLLKTPIDGMSESDYTIIKNTCKDKYPEDFNMREFCERQQVEGWTKIQ